MIRGLLKHDPERNRQKKRERPQIFQASFLKGMEEERWEEGARKKQKR